jgi:hypothetical protein
MREHVPPIAGELDRRGQERHARLDGGRQQCHRRFQSFPALRRCSGTARMRHACGEQTRQWPSAAPLAGGYRYPHRPYMISMLLYHAGVLTGRGHFDAMRGGRRERGLPMLNPPAGCGTRIPPPSRQHRPEPAFVRRAEPLWSHISEPFRIDKAPLAGDALRDMAAEDIPRAAPVNVAVRQRGGVPCDCV